MAGAMDGRTSPGEGFSVVWTRGRGCAELAGLLDPGTPTRVQGDLREACVEARAHLLVARRLPPGFDFASVAVPSGLDPDRVGSVSAAVSGGPHSELAARIAVRIAGALGVEAEMVSAYPTPDDRRAARDLVAALSRKVPALPHRIVETAGAGELIQALPTDALLVLGAPGGWWLQRAFFGTGVRLRQRAPAGAIVVQQAPLRVYHRMGEPAYVSRHLLVADAIRVVDQAVAAVVEEGKLVGLIRRSALGGADPTTSVGRLMEDPVAIDVGAGCEEAEDLVELFEGAPIPVVDADGLLVGSVSPP